MARNYSEDALKHKREYDIKYLKDNYGQLRISMRKEELEDVKNTLKEYGFSNIQFIRLCIKLLKEGKIKKD